MTAVENRVIERGLVLPRPLRPPPGVTVPFAWVRVHGDRAFASGHGPLTEQGEIAGPFGKVPGDVSVTDARTAASGALLSLLSSLARALGDLDRIAAWLTLTGFVNADAGFAELTGIVNPASELLVDLFGSEIGAHARVAPGVAGLPFDLPVVLAAEVQLHG